MSEFLLSLHLCVSLVSVCLQFCFVIRNEELRQAEAARMEQMQRYEANHLGGFRPIYPTEGEDKYEKYFQQSSSLFQETVASKAREDCSRSMSSINAFASSSQNR